MAIKEVTKKPATNKQVIKSRFWSRFNAYCKASESFCSELKPHPYADIRKYQDYAVGYGAYHLTLSIDFQRSKCSVGIYFRDIDAWDVYHKEFRETIDENIGKELEWTRHNTKGAAYFKESYELSNEEEWGKAFDFLISAAVAMKREFAKYHHAIKKYLGKEHSDDDFEELSESEVYYEGAKKTVVVNQYERNIEARQQCIAVHGTKCKVCGIDFEKFYGEIGHGFIHVHHIVPISTIGEEYQLDPIKDLVPVCPNCHAMLHRGIDGRVLTIDELKELISAK